MRIITVVESQSMPENYEITHRDCDKKDAYVKYCYSKEAAAAQAMELAITADKYTIFASAKVSILIPDNMRSK